MLHGWQIWLTTGAVCRAGRSYQRKPRSPLQRFEQWYFGPAGVWLPVLVISYPWLDRDHPDRAGELLRRVAFVLKAFASSCDSSPGSKVGVFWDYGSLPQRSRSCPEGGMTEHLQNARASSVRSTTWGCGTAIQKHSYFSCRRRCPRGVTPTARPTGLEAGVWPRGT